MLRLLGRNAALLYLMFVLSAMLNLVPQAWFARVTPESKTPWLAGTLFIGTFGALGGLALAKRWGFGTRPWPVGAALLLLTGGLMIGSFGLASAPLYLGLCVLVRGVATYATQELDRRAVARSGPEQRRANDQVGLALRFTGMLLGPLFFGLFPEAGPVMWLGVGGLAGLALFSAWDGAAAPHHVAPEAVEAGGPLPRRDRLIVFGARTIYAGYFLLASSIVYVLTDVHHLSDAVSRGGTIITVVYAAAIAATLALSLRKTTGRRGLLGMLPSPVLLLGLGFALPTSATASLPLTLAGAVALGASFAAFQLAFRDHVTWEAVHHGRTGLIAAYNNLGNTSALIGFATMAGLVGLSKLSGLPYAQGLVAGVSGLGLVSIPAVLGAYGVKVSESSDC